MSKEIKIAVVGATGLVGQTMLKVLEDRKFPAASVKLIASEKTAGQIIHYRGEDHSVEVLNEDSFNDVDIALFSCGKKASLKYAPIAAKAGSIVVDNSSAWRMHKDVPLVVPEVNPEDLDNHNGIIANPNCSTIQMLVAIKPLHDKYNLKRLIISTYQSVSGAGQKGVNQLLDEITGKYPEQRISDKKVAFNTVFHDFDPETGFTEEETKMINETRKILHEPDMLVAVTCVRLPVLGGHGESLNLEFNTPFEIDDIKHILNNSDGIELVDNPAEDKYPHPDMSYGTDPVYVGRIRRDTTVENGLYLWVVADNLRKGAATNAVQIAETIIQNNKFDFVPADFDV